ncbi:MAG TPA: hypothetical protein PLK77_05145 [Pyrinomonadaceae bacterium]|nr:hypothetical protein [Pyrinomonadaceae bacterium]
MSDYVLELFTRYRTAGVLIDTNLLLLFIVGSVDSDLISQISRTSNYSFQDFQLVEKAVDFFETKITTPHILTEVSNLISRLELQQGLSTYIQKASEEFVESSQVVVNKFFTTFGLTDTAVLDLAINRYLVLTDDGPLFGMLTNSGADAVNLDTLRKSAL